MEANQFAKICNSYSYICTIQLFKIMSFLAFLFFWLKMCQSLFSNCSFSSYCLAHHIMLDQFCIV